MTRYKTYVWNRKQFVTFTNPEEYFSDIDFDLTTNQENNDDVIDEYSNTNPDKIIHNRINEILQKYYNLLALGDMYLKRYEDIFNNVPKKHVSLNDIPKNMTFQKI